MKNLGLKSSFLIAWRSLSRRKTKNLSAILAVTLGVTLLVGIQITTATLENAFITSLLQTEGEVDLRVANITSGGYLKAADQHKIEDLLDGVGIKQQAKQYPAQLSGGQMQRVAIARALTNRPQVLFADEPTGDLDSETGKQVMELIKKFHEETKTTIIIITHEQDIANYAQRQIKLEDGVIKS